MEPEHKEPAVVTAHRQPARLLSKSNLTGALLMLVALGGTLLLIQAVAGAFDPGPRGAASGPRLRPAHSAGRTAITPVPAPQLAPGQEPLACALLCEQTRLRLGDSPRIAVVLTNRTDQDLVLVPSLEGSSRRWRFPHCYFVIEGPEGPRGLTPGGLRQPELLRDDDFEVVPAQGTFLPLGAGEEGVRLPVDWFDVPGRYSVRFVYSTESEDPADWLASQPWQSGGQAEPEVLALLAAVPKATVRSAPITIDIIGRR